MTAEEKKKIREELPKNYLSILKKRTGFGRIYVWQVINEKDRNSDQIWDAALQLAIETKQNEESRKHLINSL